MTVRVNKPSFNIREKLSELGRKFGLKGSELAAAETVQEARDLVSAGRKNIIINGSMQVSQRVAYPSTQPTVSYSNYYTVDRWRMNVQMLSLELGLSVKVIQFLLEKDLHIHGNGITNYCRYCH